MQKRSFISCIPIIIFLITALYSCSQSLYSIKQSYAFTKEIYSGNIPVGINGKPSIHGTDTTYIIFLETNTSNVPPWNTALVNAKEYNVTPVAVNQDSVFIGESKADKHRVVLTPHKGNHLWQLQLQAKDLHAINVDSININSENKIILLGEFHSKKIMFTINKPIELLPEMNE